MHIAVFVESCKQHKMVLGDYIRASFVDDDRRFRDNHDPIADRNQGHVEFTVNLVQLLVDKGLITKAEIDDLLPHSNYRKLVDLTDEW